MPVMFSFWASEKSPQFSGGVLGSRFAPVGCLNIIDLSKPRRVNYP